MADTALISRKRTSNRQRRELAFLWKHSGAIEKCKAYNEKMDNRQARRARERAAAK